MCTFMLHEEKEQRQEDDAEEEEEEVRICVSIYKKKNCIHLDECSAVKIK